MPRYFFHLRNSVSTTDAEGLDLPDHGDALTKATEFARDVASADVKEGALNLGHHVICVDEAGNDVGTIFFRDAIKIVG